MADIRDAIIFSPNPNYAEVLPNGQDITFVRSGADTATATDSVTAEIESEE